MPTKDRAMSRAVEMAMETSGTHALREDADEGQGDEQSSREAKTSVWNSRTAERLPMRDSVMSRAAEMVREASRTHELRKDSRRRTG
jgi:hypothetical protein